VADIETACIADAGAARTARSYQR